MDPRSEAGAAPPVEREGPVLLYDGECGLCAASVQFMLHRDRQGGLRFAPLQGRFGSQLRTRHPELAGVDSIVWLEAGRPRVRSDAALRAAAYLGGWWRLALLARILPRPVRDSAYNLVARHRHRMVRGGEACLVPSVGDRGRFLE